MTGHAYDGSLQKAQVGDQVAAGIEKALVHIFVQEIFGPGQAANTIEKAIDDNFITPQLNDSLNACKAVEEVSKDPVAAEQFLKATVGASNFPKDFNTCKTASERADCMIAALEKNDVDLSADEMKGIVDAAKSPGGQTKVRLACTKMAAKHPVP